MVCFTVLTVGKVAAQDKEGFTFVTSDNKSMVLPLGKISFADTIISYNIGTPKPMEKYRDSTLALKRPDYINYKTPRFASLGCGGSMIVGFTDNGFMNLPGDDLYLFEVGPSREAAHIEISEGGTHWVPAGKIRGGRSTLNLDQAGIDTETVFYYVRITDLKDLCAGPSAGADIDAVAAINSVIKLTINADILFDVAEHDLKETAEETLRELAQTVLSVEKATLLIEGHTDSDGKPGYNMALSKRRCAAVRDGLKAMFGTLAQNFDLVVIPYGENSPKYPNDTAKNKQMNRRVEVTVLPPKSYYDSLPKKKG
ncbi:MAG: OmpA family protein [Marinirhabdus sp.]